MSIAQLGKIELKRNAHHTLFVFLFLISLYFWRKKENVFHIMLDCRFAAVTSINTKIDSVKLDTDVIDIEQKKIMHYHAMHH